MIDRFFDNFFGSLLAIFRWAVPNSVKGWLFFAFMLFIFLRTYK